MEGEDGGGEEEGFALGVVIFGWHLVGYVLWSGSVKLGKAKCVCRCLRLSDGEVPRLGLPGSKAKLNDFQLSAYGLI